MLNRRSLGEHHQFEVVFLILQALVLSLKFGYTMSNWRVFLESKDVESQPDEELDLSLTQLPVQPPQLVVSEPPLIYFQDEAGPSRPLKQPRLEQRWHGNLQRDARALVILLQVGCVEPGTREVTFEGCFEGLNDDQYLYMVRPIRGSPGHSRWLKGPVNPLAKADRANYVAATVKRILEFLEME